MHVTFFRGKCHSRLVSFHATLAAHTINTPLQFVSLDLPPSGQCRTLVIGQGFSSFEKWQALKYGPAEQNRILARAIVEKIGSPRG